MWQRYFRYYQKLKIFIILVLICTEFARPQGTQFNDVLHNDTQHNGIICDIQHNSIKNYNTVSLCQYNVLLVMLSVVVLVCIASR